MVKERILWSDQLSVRYFYGRLWDERHFENAFHLNCSCWI